MVSKENNVITVKKYYIGEYELTQNVEVPSLKEVTYISAPTGLVAAEVKIDTVPTLYYILTDHLGSITQLLTAQGSAVGNARFTYDAWGRLRDVRSPNPYMIGNAQTTAFHILDRGYCGHEHLLDHGIINMNGRIYDPITAQFMQADNYIQTPEDYIGYNRYAYCRYNPFKYTDPSGEQYLAGSGGGGVMAAVGAAIIAAEEQAQNAMAMALGAAMSNWNPNATRHGIEQMNRMKEQFGGASGGSASDGGFFGKVIKAVGSVFSKLFGKSDPKGDAKTSIDKQLGKKPDGTPAIHDTELDGEGKTKLGEATPIFDENGKPIANPDAYNCASHTLHSGLGDPDQIVNQNEPVSLWGKWDDDGTDDMGDLYVLPWYADVQVGDIITWRLTEKGSIKHWGTVSGVEDGLANRCISKWGQGPLWEHHPRDVDNYGPIRTYYRWKLLNPEYFYDWNK